MFSHPNSTHRRDARPIAHEVTPPAASVALIQPWHLLDASPRLPHRRSVSRDAVALAWGCREASYAGAYLAAMMPES